MGIFNKNKRPKVRVEKEITNVMGKPSSQIVLIEQEFDGTAWAIVNHDNEELSMSYENLVILKHSITQALIEYQNKVK